MSQINNTLHPPVFENREKMVLVMEYAAGGELYDYLSERKVLSEDEARRVFRHVASATYYCHKVGCSFHSFSRIIIDFYYSFLIVIPQLFQTLGLGDRNPCGFI